MKNLIFIFAIFFVISTENQAAGFDCKKASTLVENAICSDSELSDLDESMTAAYRDALANSDSSENIKSSQRNWLKKRNTCKDATCLKNSYTQRINALNNLAGSPSNHQNNNKTLPQKVGACTDSTIMEKNTRFEGAVAGEAGGEVNVLVAAELGLYIQSVSGLPDSANADKYMYSTNDFAIGDKIKLCLIALPEDCPKGDDRGKVYTVTNYKNDKSFTGVDAWHLCGGA